MGDNIMCVQQPVGGAEIVRNSEGRETESRLAEFNFGNY